MKHFFLTCLPRSRSAHFSALLTHGKTFCFHDAFDGLETFDDFIELMNFGEGGFDTVGVSDPALLYFWPKVHAAFPDAKWVVVERAEYDVYQSLKKFNVGMEAVVDAKRRLIELTAKLNPLVVNFDEINPSTVNRIATYLDIDVGHPERVAQLCKMNIQIEHNYMRERITHNVANPSQLLKEIAA